MFFRNKTQGNMRRRALLLGGASALLLQSRRSYAIFGVGDIVFDPQQYAQSLLSYAQQAKQYAVELEQQITQLSMLKNMVQNTLQAPLQLYGQIQSIVWQVQDVSRLGSLLSGNSGSIIQRLNSLDGYTSYLQSLGTGLENLPRQFDAWNQQLGNSFATLGKTLGIQQDDLKTQAAFQQSIQAQAATTGGQLQVLQAGVQMAASNGAILQQMEQTLIASAQATASFQTAQADRQALGDAELQRLTSGPELPVTGHDIKLPYQ